MRRIQLSQRQRETLRSVFLNAGNAVLIAWVLGNLTGQAFRIGLAMGGMSLYVTLTTLAVLVDR